MGNITGQIVSLISEQVSDSETADILFQAGHPAFRIVGYPAGQTFG